jgi:ParB family chromosome partitioning protein
MSETPALEVRALPMAKVHRDPTQPRKIFTPGSIAELAGSIRENGLLQPIGVRPDGDGWRIVFGERRWRAHQHNKARMILARVLDLTGTDVLVTQIIENAAREPMTALEEAHAYQRLVDELGGDVEAAAKALGKVPFRITERTSLLKLEDEYLQLLASGNLTNSQAYEMAQLSPVGQRRLFGAIKAGQCPTYKALRAMSLALREAEAQVSIFDQVVAAQEPPSQQELRAASRLEKKIDQVSKILAMGFDDNEIVAVKRIDPGKAATYADKLALIQKHLAQMELALRASAVIGDLFAA